jgi:hypothetical protein
LSWTETFNCDICGKQKGSTDHWWLAWSEPFSPHPDAPERNMLKIYPWENMLAHDASAKHLCGQACLQKLVDRWLNTEMNTTHGSAAQGSASHASTGHVSTSHGTASHGPAIPASK